MRMLAKRPALADIHAHFERRDASVPESVMRDGEGSVLQAFTRSIEDGSAFLWLIAIAFWVSTHPFVGIIDDGTFYMGRALADLDPLGVGRDMAFVHDGQSRFSLFPQLLDHLIRTFGSGPTAIILATLSMAVWISAIAILARQFVPTRYAALVVLCVALMPTSYGTPNSFSYSEILTVPRPFAEALVIFALAALVARYDVIAFLCLIGASLIHPIMALAGWGVMAAVLCAEDRRWRIAAVAVLAACLAAAFLRVPVFVRLITQMDPDLKAFIVYRSAHLFPTQWSWTFIGPVIVETSSLLIAASFFAERRRLIMIAAIAVGLGGIATQALLGDHLSLLLVIQAQLWRMTWLLAAMGAAALGFVVINLWNRGPRDHVVLALLAMGWMTSGEPLAAGSMCIAALVIQLRPEFLPAANTWKIARLIWAVAIALDGFYVVDYLIDYHSLLGYIPAGAYSPGMYFWIQRHIAFPIIGIFLFLMLRPPSSRAMRAVVGIATAALVVIVAWLWNERRPFQALMDEGHHPPTLEALIANRPGEVLWIDGFSESWFLTGRPQWASRQQGVSSVFSRDLALEWRERMQFLIDQNLAERSALLAIPFSSAEELPHLTVRGVHNLCARKDAPAWIIAPVMAERPIPAALKPQYWRLEKPNFLVTAEPTSYAWHPISAYAVLPCAGT